MAYNQYDKSIKYAYNVLTLKTSRLVPATSESSHQNVATISRNYE